MSPLASLKHHAEEDLSVPTGWKKSRQSQTATTRKGLGKFLVIRSGSVDRNLMSTVIQRGRALIIDISARVMSHESGRSRAS